MKTKFWPTAALVLVGVISGPGLTQDARAQDAPPPAPAQAQAPMAPDAPSPADAQDQPPLVTNLFLDTDIHQALADISDQTGVPILVGTTVEGGVTLQLDHVPLPRALDMILAPGGYYWREKKGYILVGPAVVDSPLFLDLSETRNIKLSNLTAEAALASLSPAIRPYCTADPERNAIAITAPAGIVERVAQDIKALDVPLQHVLLEGRVVVLERQSLLDLGVDWDFPTVQVGSFNGDALDQSFPLAVSVGLSPDVQFTDSLMMSLNLLRENREASIVSNPQLTVEDGHEATMGVTTEERFQIESRDDIDLEVVSSGTTLTINPRIGANGKITLDMNIEVSNVVGRGIDNLPVVTRRTATSTVQVASGGTAAISGLTETRDDITGSTVPGFGDIPLLGYGFHNEDSSRFSKQLAVFITATIVEQPPPRLPSKEAMPPVPVSEFRQQIVDFINNSKKTTQP